jgi:hypothetical protein
MVYRSNARAALAPLTLMFLVSAISGCGSSSNSSDGAPTPPTAASTATPPTTTAPPAAPPTASTLVTASNNGDACLPAAMPSTGALFNSSKRVFAHYFNPYPLSIDNAASADDYYNRNYLTKTGESSKWAAQGGFLRQRPAGVTVSPKTNWLQLNMEREVSAAIARGITGFTFDSLSATDATDSNSALHLMLGAAHTVDSRFKIMVMPDITALGSDSNAVVEIIAAAAASPAAYRLSDGRLVVTAFDAGLNPPSWWQSVISRLASQGIHIAFVPTFLGWSSVADAFAPFSYGFGDWGSATVGNSSAQQGDPEIAHKTGKIFMMPVDPQQYRPKDSVYWEAGNSGAFRDAWNSSIQGDADWIQLVTWNDFTETSAISPTTDATLQRTIGTGFYNLTGYYASWFLNGEQPKITHDVLYYFYRREATTAASPAQKDKVTLVTGTAENNIELLAFLTSPGVLKITVGGKTYTQNAAAGVVSFKVPSQAGTPLFTLSRSGADVFSFHGGVPIYGSAGLPSGIQDLTYWNGSASKTGVCAL